MSAEKSTSWRELLPVHPAAELFPPMSPEELQELAEDIRANGLRNIVTTWFDKDEKEWLIDGRNRLDALELLGYRFSRVPLNGGMGIAVSTDQFRINKRDGSRKTVYVDNWHRECETRGTYRRTINDPYALAVSLNIHRRHLTAKQKRELTSKLLRANPACSDRAIAKLAKVDNETVAAVRERLEANEEIPHNDERTETDGRKARGRKPIGVAKAPAEGQAVQANTRALAMSSVEHGAEANTAARSGFLASIKGLWPRLTTKDKAEFLAWVHDNEYELYHKRCREAGKQHLRAAG